VFTEPRVRKRQRSLAISLQPLKPKQLEALVYLLREKIPLLPYQQGYGKSIVFAVLPLVFDKMVAIMNGIITSVQSWEVTRYKSNSLRNIIFMLKSNITRYFLKRGNTTVTYFIMVVTRY